MSPILDQEEVLREAVAGSSELAWWPLPVALVALLIFFWLPDLRLQRPLLRRWNFSPMAGLFLFAATLVGGLLGGSIVGSLVMAEAAVGDSAAANDMDMRSMACVMVGNYVGQGIVLFLVPGLILGPYQRENPARPPVSWWRALLAGGGGLMLFWPMVLAAGILAGWMISAMTGQELPEIAHQTLLQLQEAAASPDAWLVIVLVFIVVVTPVWEELLYRGVLQESLRRLPMFSSESPWIAIALTSVVFAVMHGAVVDQRGLVALIVLSLGFGWIALRTGRLLASMVMHSLFNAINLLQVLA